MQIGIVTGSIARIGSGRTEAVPLARALTSMDCTVHGLETTRLRRSPMMADGLEVRFEPVVPYLAQRFIRGARKFLGPHPFREGLSMQNLAQSDALLALGNRLDVDAVYAFHNTNAARLLRGWPHPSRLLAINLIGFGIDPSRGGAADTFPLQNFLFSRPYWDLHITATQFEFKQYQEVYDRLGISTDKLMHLPHSYDEDLFHPSAVASRVKDRQHDGTTMTLLYPVNVYPRKNIELAIDVLATLNQDFDSKLIVTGAIWDEGYRTQLQQHARRSGVAGKVTFLGGVPLEELVCLYQQADVVVYTSHQETFGHGIVESLACGTPVVGPDWIHPCREILNCSPGGWAAPKSIEGFAAAVREALRSGVEPQLLACHARTTYGNTAIAARFLDRCRQLKDEKDRYVTTLASINWKELYRDAGNLL